MPAVPSAFRPAVDLRRHWGVFVGLVVALGIWCGVDVMRRARIDPARPALHMTDFTVYTEAGAAFFDGREPYDVANIRGWKYLYPPLFALLVAPLSALPTHWQAAVWFTLSALMTFGCYFECRCLASAFSTMSFLVRVAPGPDSEKRGVIDVGPLPQPLPAWLFVTALLAVLFPALNCLQRGQMGIALVYPLLLGFRLVCLGNSAAARFLGGIVLALPVALKLTPALPAVCILATSIATLFLRRFVDTDGAAANRTPHSDENIPHLWKGGQGGVATATCSPSTVVIVPGAHSRSAHPAFPTPHSALPPTFGLLVGSLLFFFLLPAALIGWNENLRHLETWYLRVASRVNDVRDDDFGGDVASFRNQSLHNAVYRGGNWIAHAFFGGPDDQRIDVTQAAMPMDAPLVSHLLSVARVAALAAIGVVIVAAARGGHLLLHGAAFGLACVATLVVSPVSRGHYFVFWLPAVVFVPLWFQRIGRTRTAFALALVPAALTLAHYALLPYAGRIGLLGLGTTAWFFTACQRIWTSRSEGECIWPQNGPMESKPFQRLTEAA